MPRKRSKNDKGAKELFEEVIQRGLCTGCGACITGCPYFVVYEGKVVALDKCTNGGGDCYKHCPRTHTDMNAISRKVFGTPYRLEAIGQVSEIVMARTAIREVRERAQDGGAVTTLLKLAMEKGIVDAVVCTRMDDEKRPHGYVARKTSDLFTCSGSSYEAGFALEAYRRLPKENEEKLAIVGLGCQVEALSKMKLEPPQNGANPDNIRLTMGLFCGWALRPDVFHSYLKDLCDLSKVLKFDIPHTPSYSFDVYGVTKTDTKSVSLDEVRPYINPACSYCWDLTAEFSDISVGSAGSAFPGWNTVIARGRLGADLIEDARKKGILETKPLPDARLSHLEKVAFKRKCTAFRNIVSKTGDKNNLLYIGGLDRGVAERFLAGEGSE
jgi:coenzyme F420 hydrogenase subunit beta